MSKARIINIVATDCPPADEAKFNKWYDDVHIPMLMKYKGIKKVTRYKVAGDTKMAKYLAVYEYDSKKDMDAQMTGPEFKAAIDEMNETMKSCKFEIKWAVTGEPLKDWGK